MKRIYHFLRAWLASKTQDNPSKKIFVIGVTGTKGKTTVAELLNAILEAAGKKTALLSSLRVKIDGKSEKNQLGNSMPGRGYIQEFLRRAVAAGCSYAVIEATSQGAVQSRHRFIEWNAGVWTNLSPEHIESHGSFENYRDAKLGFLRYVAEGGGRVFLNHDDKYFTFFDHALKKYSPIAFSPNDEGIAHLMPRPTATRSAADAAPPPFLLSDFNKSNIAAAVVVAKRIGVEEKIIEEALLHFKGVPGRMEFVQWKPFAVIVDYAHTPDSLRAAYRAARELITDNPSPITNSGYQSSVMSHELICVLGAAGGGRDKWKRPEMGEAAAEFCNEIVLTNEDPYNEKPEEIIEEIAAGFPADERNFNAQKITDRREAIKKAIMLARPGDAVIMTGKGSEDFIHVAKAKKIPWNERRVAEEILSEAKKGRGY